MVFRLAEIGAFKIGILSRHREEKVQSFIWLHINCKRVQNKLFSTKVAVTVQLPIPSPKGNPPKNGHFFFFSLGGREGTVTI